MARTVKPPTADPPKDTVRVALASIKLQKRLLGLALAFFLRRVPHRPLDEQKVAATEALHEVCVRALQKCAKYDPQWDVGAWLYGIMNKVLREAVRARRNHSPPQLPDQNAWNRLQSDLGLDTAELVRTRLDANSYLAKLEPEHQEMMRLRYYEDLRFDEIGVRLRISAGNARIRHYRAIAALKEIAAIAPRENVP